MVAQLFQFDAHSEYQDDLHQVSLLRTLFAILDTSQQPEKPRQLLKMLLKTVLDKHRFEPEKIYKLPNEFILLT